MSLVITVVFKIVKETREPVQIYRNHRRWGHGHAAVRNWLIRLSNKLVTCKWWLSNSFACAWLITVAVNVCLLR